MTVLTPDLLTSFDASVTDVATAQTMPPAIYTSEEFLEFERRAVFAHEWLCVGVASRIPNVGDYFTTSVNGAPLGSRSSTSRSGLRFAPFGPNRHCGTCTSSAAT